MIDLTKTVLPEAIAVGERYYRIHTDFRYMIMLQNLLQKDTTPLESYGFLFIDPLPAHLRLEGLYALISFMNPPQELPRSSSCDKGVVTVLDYHLDADFIYAAFMQQYGIDLVTAYLHWYQFCALLAGLKDTKLNDIIGFRLWKHTGKEKTAYDKHMQALHDAWEIRKVKKEDVALAAFEAQLTRGIK